MAGGLGGGVIIAFAAVLWLLYLTPTWLRRREYLRTERTAVRLQQTLRVLAETAEVPEEVRAEVSARSVADRHRALREAARRAEQVVRPRTAAAERAVLRSGRGPRRPKQRLDAAARVTQTRLRRSRVLAANVLVVGLTLAGWGASDVVAGGPSEFLIAGVVVSLAAVALLQRSSTVAAAHRAVDAVDQAVVVPETPRSFTDWQREEPGRPTWTPVPVPRPLYLQREEASTPTRDQVATAASLRAAHAAPEVAALTGHQPYEEVASRNESGPVLTDLDGVLRRRRSA